MVNSFKSNSPAKLLIAPTDRVPSRKFASSSSQLPALFDRSLTLDPMSLVASPSRGLDHQLTPGLNQLDLTNADFQAKYFAWLQKRIQHHRHSFASRLAPNRHRTQLSCTPDHKISEQLDSLSTLVREIRKLREGIVATGRSDAFAVQVYELSAELALEACDFDQLKTLLPHLIFNLYPLHHSQHQLDRQLLFASVFLLLPIATGLSLVDFLTHFSRIHNLLLPTSPFSVTRAYSHSARLRATLIVFNSVRRRNWVELNRRTRGLVGGLSQDETINWDTVLILQILKQVRKEITWKNLRSSYNSICDDDYLARSLALQPRELDSWLKDAGVCRLESGAVPLRLARK